jgi:hypothetical protein
VTPVIALLAVIGVGLLYQRRWAALIFSLATLWGSIGVVRQVIHHVDPQGSVWADLFFAALLASPSVCTVKYWHNLVWRHENPPPPPPKPA